MNTTNTNTNLRMSGNDKQESNIVTKMVSEMIANLQCPVCMQLCDPPLMSCPNGHFTCSNCIARLTGETLKRKSCPQCRDTGFIRNLPYEKMALELLAETELKCPHSEDESGTCQDTYKYGELSHHLNKCKGLTQKYHCPCPSCTERNLYSLPELIEHIFINMGFDTEEEYRFNFVPSVAVGTLDALIGGTLAKIEGSAFGKNLGMRLSVNESCCSYSPSPIINFELHSDAYVGYNYCVLYPPYDFFNNFKKEDDLLATSNTDTSDKTEMATNFTFLIDTNQIYLVRTTCSLNSTMIYCDGTYLNTQYMDDTDPHRVYGLLVNYNYNSDYSKDKTSNSSLTTNSDEPERKRANRHTVDKIKYFESTYFEITKYVPEMSEEVLNGTSIETSFITSKQDALEQIKWTLVFQ